MAYTIYNNDGSILLTLADGSTDSVTTSITLVGRNVNSYGQILMNDLVKMMGNFAGTTQPTSPIVGQLWYDTADGRIKVYTLGQTFSPITSVISAPFNNSATGGAPNDLVANDFWFDTTNQQLYYSQAGFAAPKLIAPRDSVIYGNTGWITETIQDSELSKHNVTKLYNSGLLMGILSANSFTLAVSTAGMTEVGVGFNLNTSLPGVKFWGTATSADAIAGIDANRLLVDNATQTIYGELSIANNAGLHVIGYQNEDFSLQINTSTYGVSAAVLGYGSANKPLSIEVNGQFGETSAVFIDAADSRIGLWDTNPQFPLDVKGNTRIQGNLTVIGTITNVASANLQLYEPLLTLGYGQLTPSDTFISGGGVLLSGANRYSLTWNDNGTGWNSSDNFNLTNSTSTYQIGGIPVITNNSLGRYITSAPGVISLGTLTNLSVGNISISGNTMTVSGNLILSPSGQVSLNSGTITNVGYPVNDSDAATKKYVLDTFYLSHANALSMTLDITNFTAKYGSIYNGILLFLNNCFPVTNTGTDVVFNLPNGTRTKVVCGTTYFTVPSTSTNVTFNHVTDQIYAQSYNGGPYQTFNVVDGGAGTIEAYITSSTQFFPSTSYQVQTWYVESGTWTHATTVFL